MASRSSGVVVSVVDPSGWCSPLSFVRDSAARLAVAAGLARTRPARLSDRYARAVHVEAIEPSKAAVPSVFKHGS